MSKPTKNLGNLPRSVPAVLSGMLIGAAGMLMGATGAYAQAPAPLDDNAVTPRDAQGRPVLVGLWNGPVPAAPLGILRGTPGGDYDFVDFVGRGGTFRGFEEDGGLLYHDNPNKPIYKPEFWDVVGENNYWGNQRDPINYCTPIGVPRLLGPTQILRIEGQPILMLIYSGKFQTDNRYRMIPTDGRPINPAQAAGETYMGAPTGRWDGDTLVIETTGFTDNTWLDKGGYVHGFKMKVTERLTRKGNALIWEATVEDPEYLAEPWKMTPTAQWLNPNPNAFLAEALPCDSRIAEPWGTEDNPQGSPTRSGPL